MQKEYRSPGWVVWGTILIATSFINKLFNYDSCLKLRYALTNTSSNLPKCTYFNGMYYGDYPNDLYHFIGFNLFLILGTIFVAVYLVPKKRKRTRNIQKDN